MKIIGFAALSAGALFATAAMAAESKLQPSGVKLSASECTSVWQQANPSGAAGLTAAQSAPYVANFKAANPDGDTTIDQNEWMAACNKGLVKASGSSGSSSGASGSSGASDKSGGAGAQQ